MSERIETIKRRLKRRNAWHHNYLDDLVDSTTRMIMNRLSNKGPRAQCEFLIENGWTVDEIVKHGKQVSKLIRGHVAKMHKHHHKHRR